MAGTQLPLFLPESRWTPPALSSLPSWKGAKRIAIDTETRDPDLRKMGCGARRTGCHIVGVSFAIEDGPGFYLPVRHEGGDNLDAQQVFNYLREQAASFTGDICGAKLDYDLDYLANEKVDFRAARFFRDVQVAEPLIDELQDSYSLEAIAQRRLSQGKSEELLREAAACYRIDPKRDLWRMPARFVGAYAEQDAHLPLVLLRRQERDIDEQDLWGVYDLESRLLPVLVHMRRRGVRVDQDRLRWVERWCLEREQEHCAIVKDQTGIAITPNDLWKSGAIAPALHHIGVAVPSTPRTNKPSVSNGLLSSVDHPVTKALARARTINKVRTTFAAATWRYMCNGRIHCTFNQLRRSREDADDEGGANMEEGQQGGRFGRLSCVHPNLQQQPARDEELGPLWRSIYVADEGGQWATNDFSQQEPRWTVHYAVLCGLPKAEAAAERYRRDPKTDNHQMMADMAGIKRKAAKEIFLGLCYGMGGAKLCRKLGLPTEWVVNKQRRRVEVAGPEGKALLDRFDREVPFVRKLAKRCEAEAAKRGYIRTVSGRRCRFPQNPDGSYDWTHKALNRLIQGASADQAKMSMIAVEEAGHAIQLQVHDEIDLTVRNRAHAEEVAEIMRECVKLQVPNKVDVEIGKSWGEIA